MCEHNTDYQSLSQRVDEEVKRQKSDFPDFSTTGMMIDDLVNEEELHKYDPQMVVEVAAQYGFEIKVCRFGENAHTHESPKVRANGVWLTIPEHLKDAFERGGKYLKQEDSTICPDCATEYPKLCRETSRKIKALQKEGIEGVANFSCFTYIF